MIMSLNKSTKSKLSLTVQQKIEIVQKLENGVAPTALANEYNTSLVTFRCIRKDAESLQHYADQGNHVLKRKNRRKPIYTDIETCVYQWYLEQKAQGSRLTDAMLQQKAREFSNESGPSKFNASRGWVTKFKIRHNIQSPRTHRKEEPGTECPSNNDVYERIAPCKVTPKKTLNAQEFEPPVQYPLEFVAVPKVEEADIHMEEQENEYIQIKQEKEEKDKVEQINIKEERELQENVEQDIKRKELREALKTMEKYARNKKMLTIARSLISDLLEDDT